MVKKTHISHNGSKLDRLDTFVLTGVVTILLTRSFLAITAYPQIGSDSLHVAHVLYGGAILVASFLYLLLANKPNGLFASIVGGVGFGLFIDEIGKFVTKDNDYFFQPAVGLIYLSFLIIWFIARIIVVRSEGLPFLSPAEWPSKRWQRFLILLWSVCAVLSNILFVIAILIYGFSTVASTLGVPRVGLVAALLYGLFLVFGILRYIQHRIDSSAHILRGAYLYGVTLVFPFYYFTYPLLASILLFPTIIVIIGLSEVSVIRLLKRFRAEYT